MKFLVVSFIILSIGLNVHSSANIENLNRSILINDIPIELEYVTPLNNVTKCYTLKFSSINYTLDESCTSGGAGSTNCSISMASVECSVTCGNGYYSCCSFTRLPACGCIPNDINQLPEGG